MFMPIDKLQADLPSGKQAEMLTGGIYVFQNPNRSNATRAHFMA
jgi:hypothetical protein